METLKTGKIEELLGTDAEALLNHTCKTIDKSSLNLPGPDFVDRMFRRQQPQPSGDAEPAAAVRDMAAWRTPGT
jgi:hypothetical protein